jgi:hypothetical protein
MCKQKQKFVAIKGVLYPACGMLERSFSCPIPLGCFLAFEFQLTPEGLQKEIDVIENHIFGKLCWTDCPEECQAKETILKTLANLPKR